MNIPSSIDNNNSAKEINTYAILQNAHRQRVSDGKKLAIFSGCQSVSYTLVIILPQLGDFDSLEYAWWLKREASKISAKNITLRVIGIGDRKSGQKFCQYTRFPPQHLFIDPDASVHRQLNLYQGLSWSLPFFAQRPNAWFNLLLMCVGIGSKGTLKEVFRGYKGDRSAPSLFREEEQINIKPFSFIKGSLFNLAGKDYQRPFELATLRLQNMVEVLNDWQDYVPDDRYITQRGGTFLFNHHGDLIYEYRDRGILGFAENMSNPLTFLDKIN